MTSVDLTRYWRAAHRAGAIEVQWTGLSFENPCTLRLLVNGAPKAEVQSRRNAVIAADVDGQPLTVHFTQGLLFHRCVIRSGAEVLASGSQPWNPIAMALLLVTAVGGSACGLMIRGVLLPGA